VVTRYAKGPGRTAGPLLPMLVGRQVRNGTGGVTSATTSATMSVCAKV
jgi:hypothetical protein